MKVLVVFTDMLRMNLLNIYDARKTRTSFDSLIKEIGGTLYLNCYTPAPDTPRSLACMQTGLYPERNGCDSRIKWPKFYIKSSVDTLWNILSNNKIEINYYNQASCYETGPIYIKDCKKINFYNCLDTFTGKILLNASTNELDFLTLNDYHWSIDDYGGSLKATIRAKEILSDIISSFFRKINISKYDHILMFSDHGHMLDKEGAHQKSDLEYLEDGRTKIFMFHHKKGDTTNFLKSNNNLHSIQDLFSTILELFQINMQVETSKSLLTSNGHNYLIIEDHNNFSVSLSQRILLWRYVARDKSSFYTNIYSNKSIGCIDEKKVIEKINEHSSSYADCRKQIEILQKYSNLKSDLTSYNNGKKRLSKSQKLMFKILNRINRKYLKWYF